MQTCRCCNRKFTVWDSDEALADPESGDVLLILAPASELCAACTEPQFHPFAHEMAHEEDSQ